MGAGQFRVGQFVVIQVTFYPLRAPVARQKSSVLIRDVATRRRILGQSRRLQWFRCRMIIGTSWHFLAGMRTLLRVRSIGQFRPMGKRGQCTIGICRRAKRRRQSSKENMPTNAPEEISLTQMVSATSNSPTSLRTGTFTCSQTTLTLKAKCRAEHCPALPIASVTTAAILLDSAARMRFFSKVDG